MSNSVFLLTASNKTSNLIFFSDIYSGRWELLMFRILMQNLLRLLGQKIRNEKQGQTVKEDREKRDENNKREKDMQRGTREHNRYRQIKQELRQRNSRMCSRVEMGILSEGYNLHTAKITLWWTLLMHEYNKAQQLHELHVTKMCEI